MSEDLTEYFEVHRLQGPVSPFGHRNARALRHPARIAHGGIRRAHRHKPAARGARSAGGGACRHIGADKEGFLRSARSIIQIADAPRATPKGGSSCSRRGHGLDQKGMSESLRRREIQLAYTLPTGSPKDHRKKIQDKFSFYGDTLDREVTIIPLKKRPPTIRPGPWKHGGRKRGNRMALLKKTGKRCETPHGTSNLKKPLNFATASRSSGAADERRCRA